MLIPKSPKNTNLKIYKNLTIYDAAILICSLAISITLFMNISSIHIILKTFLILFFNLPFLALVKSNKKHNCKNYVLVFRFFVFIFSNKKIPKNQSKILIPYEIDESHDLYVKIPNSNKKEYFKALEIKGFYIANSKINEQEKFINDFQEVINQINLKATIIKIKEYENWKQNLNFITNNFDQKNDFALDLVESYKNDFSKNHENQKKINYYYLVLYSIDKEKLSNEIEKISLMLKIAGFENFQLSNVDQINLISKINFFKNLELDSEYLENTNNINENLKSKFEFDKFEINKKHLKINDYFVNLQSVEEFPFEILPGWASNIFKSDSTVIWHFNSVEEDQAKVLINKAIINSRVNSINVKNKVDIEKEKFIIHNFEELAKKIAFGKESLKRSSIIFINKSTNKKDLIKLQNENIKNANLINIKINNCLYTQFNYFSKSFLKASSFDKNELFLPADTFAESWPFSTSSVNDGNSLFLGKTEQDENIILDIFTKNDDRKNFNTFILGTSGSGKSTLAKKILANQITSGNKVIIIDPENEYATFSKRLNGENINLNINSDKSLNPLEIIDNFLDDFETSKNNHLMWLKEWFKILYKELNEEDLRRIIFNVNLLYSDEIFLSKIKDKSISSKDFPIISDLIKILKSNDDKSLKKIINILEFDFENNGKFSKLYNKSKNLNFENNLVVINVKDIYETTSKEFLINSLFTILGFIQREINLNRFKKEKLVIFFDEAHLFIDKDNLEALNFLFRTIKRIRKYNGSVILATQNPSDFNLEGEVSRKSLAIISNTQYTFFLNLRSEDISNVSKMFSSTGGISEEEKKILTKAKKGQLILGMNNMTRKFLHLHYNEIEKDYCF